MILMNESTPDLIDQDASVVPGGAAYLHDIERRLAPYFERAESRHRVMAYLRGAAESGRAQKQLAVG